MSRVVLPAGHHRFEVLHLSRRVAAQLASEAVDPSTALAMADRYALASLSLAVEAEAARRANVEPMTDRIRVWLADELAAVECAAVSTHPAPLRVAG